MKFELGRVVMTPAAMEVLVSLEWSVLDLLNRHATGDWGDMSADDKRANETALVDGGRIFSSYKLDEETRIWVISEAVDDEGRRQVTTLLLPSDY